MLDTGQSTTKKHIIHESPHISSSSEWTHLRRVAADAVPDGNLVRFQVVSVVRKPSEGQRELVCPTEPFESGGRFRVGYRPRLYGPRSTRVVTVGAVFNVRVMPIKKDSGKTDTTRSAARINRK